MSADFMLRLYDGNRFVDEQPCLQVMLEREAYTPYEKMSGVFLSSGRDYGNVNALALYHHNVRIYYGMADQIRQYTVKGRTFVRAASKSFTSVLAQNEIVPGLHFDVTMETLMTSFYQFPYVQYENYAGTGYIYVKDGSSIWDSIVTFGYKLSGNYPYIYGNTVRLTPHASPKTTVLTDDIVTEWGEERDTTRLVSMYHMADIQGNYDAYSLANPEAAKAEIVRHKQIAMDQQFLYDPQQALVFRNQFSCRGEYARYAEYAGFHNECIHDRVSWGTFLPEAEIGRVRMTYSGGRLRTRLWAYDDGFYHIAV